MGHRDYAPSDYRIYSKEIWRAFSKLPSKRREVQRSKLISSEDVMKVVRNPRLILEPDKRG